MRPIKNTPAERAGLRAGDRILAINGESTAGMALEVAVAKIKGPPGTKVTLTIERGESERRRKETVELTRALILIPSVEWQVEEDPVAGRIGRVNILQFNEKTPEDLRKALDSLAGEEVSGLLLDLRYNPGGLLTAAVETAGCFTGEKPVVHVTQRGKKVKTYSGPSGKRWELPLVVMVNEWSASGAEILAGALKDYEIGTLVGRRTFGKGVVQDVIPLANGGAVTLTVAGYLTAGGHSIHGTGIEPNVIPEIDENLQKAVEGGDIEALEKADARTEEKAREVLREKILQARRAKRAAWRGKKQQDGAGKRQRHRLYPGLSPGDRVKAGKPGTRGRKAGESPGFLLFLNLALLLIVGFAPVSPLPANPGAGQETAFPGYAAFAASCLLPGGEGGFRASLSHPPVAGRPSFLPAGTPPFPAGQTPGGFDLG